MREGLASGLGRLGLLLASGILFMGAEGLGRAAWDEPSVVRLAAPAFSVPFPERVVSHGFAPGDGRLYLLRENAVGLPLRRESLDYAGHLENTFPEERTARLFTIGARAQFYIVDAASQLHIYTAYGGLLTSFRVAPRPASLAVLSNGEIVIGAPANGKLMQVFSAEGKWLRSVGEMKAFDASDGENKRVNQGLVLAAGDEIVYVFRYSPEATVLRFSRAGDLLLEFALRGPEIDLREATARNLIEKRASLDLGIASIDVITAAALDQQGRLWIGMNGSSQQANLHAYSLSGEQLGRYRLERADGDVPSIKGLAPTRDGLSLVDASGHIYRVPMAALPQIGTLGLEGGDEGVVGQALAIEASTGSAIDTPLGPRPP